jgi:flagellar motor switch protein FliM
LRSAWQSIATVDFFVQSHVSEPQLLQILAQDDAVVVVSMEVRVGENSGLMHLAFPSMLIKMFRERSGQLMTIRRREPTETDHARILRKLRPANVELEAQLAGPKLRLDNLMRMEVGDVLALDHALTKELELRLNGKTKFVGRVVNSGNRLGFQITGPQ